MNSIEMGQDWYDNEQEEEQEEEQQEEQNEGEEEKPPEEKVKISFYQIEDMKELFIGVSGTDFGISYPATNRSIYENILLEVRNKDVVSTAQNGDFIAVSQDTDVTMPEKVFAAVSHEEDTKLKEQVNKLVIADGIYMITGKIIELNSTEKEFKLISKTEQLVKEKFLEEYDLTNIQEIETKAQQKEGFYNYIVSIQKAAIIRELNRVVANLKVKGGSLKEEITIIDKEK
jgi:hypothetical protein